MSILWIVLIIMLGKLMFVVGLCESDLVFSGLGTALLISAGMVIAKHFWR